MKLSASLSPMSSAGSPEAAAKIFYAAATRGIAVAIAKAVEEALAEATLTAASPSIAGWEKLIGGCGIQLGWESPSIMKPLPLTQVTCFAPYTSSMPINTLGVGVSVGISITGTF